MFRHITDTQEIDSFKQWARDYYSQHEAQSRLAIDPLHHPLVRLELAKLIQIQATRELLRLAELAEVK